MSKLRKKPYKKIAPRGIIPETAEIWIDFLTRTGEEAYEAVCEQGGSQSLKDRMIVKKVYSESIESRDPLVLKISIKIKWLAKLTQIRTNIISGLEAKGAKNNIDFKIRGGESFE